jgi:DNA-directed RNA polymerase specialized sigma24 family protein
VKNDTDLTQEAFDKLLSRLAHEREEAGEKYELLRLKLTQYFTVRGCRSAEELTDITLVRVAQKMAGDTEIINLQAYCHGVARLVWLEYLKSPENNHLPLEDLPIPFFPPEDPEMDQRQKCFDQCLLALPRAEKDLILEYWQQGNQSKQRLRRQIAARLQLSCVALRIRIHRIRVRLEECIFTCLQQKAEIT